MLKCTGMENSRNPLVFVPFSEALAAQLAPLGELVPFQLDYLCLRTASPGTAEQESDDPTSSRVERLTG